MKLLFFLRSISYRIGKTRKLWGQKAHMSPMGSDKKVKRHRCPRLWIWHVDFCSKGITDIFENYLFRGKLSGITTPQKKTVLLQTLPLFPLGKGKSHLPLAKGRSQMRFKLPIKIGTTR